MDSLLIKDLVWNPFGRAAIVAVVFLGGVYLFSILAVPKIKYEGKHVLITGGSIGIGLEIAKEYVGKGANITIVARNETRLKEAQAELLKLCKPNQKVNIAKLDISGSYETVEKSLQLAVKELGNVSVLINNAGTSIAGAFESTDIQEFQRMYQVNVVGSMYVTRAVLAGMKTAAQRDGGRIVFVSSQVAQAPIYGYTAYAGSKWALRGIAEALQMELKPHNIYVSVAYPPDTATPGYEVEMLTKPEITKKISESGSVFAAREVAQAIVAGSTAAYYNISIGLDGFLLRMLHPGMSPINNLWECVCPVLLTPLSRIIAIVYVWSWDQLCRTEVRKAASASGAGGDSARKKSN